jgi:predicted metal-binding membrane protein
MLVRARHQRQGFVLVALPLTALAWATLWLWAQSPYGRYLDHGDWTQIGFAASICSTLPAGELLLPGLLFGWVLMTAAMMLPTTLPLLEIVARIGAGRPDGRLLLGLVIAGYLGV